MKILQLSSHSTLTPRHGGQIRSHHIGRILETAGFDVSRIAVCWATDDLDINDPRETIIDLKLSNFWWSETHRAGHDWVPHLLDYYSICAVAETPELMVELKAQIDAIRPDVILLEHPWTWPLIKSLAGVATGAIRVIYSSQNVEVLLKRQTLADACLTVPTEVPVGVEGVERDLVESAWATVACTQADANTFESWGAVRVVVANNGTVSKNRAHLIGALPPPLRPENRFVFFVGSAHSPNVSGFFTYLAPALPGLRPRERVVIAGGMCDAINDQIATSPIREYADGRLVSLGIVDEIALDALIMNASALLLPIGYGGGSNVKTAEALASGRPIITTSTGFRGFTEYVSLARVTIADTPDRFAKAVHQILSTPRDSLHEGSLPRELLWEMTLAPLVELLRSADAAVAGRP